MSTFDPTQFGHLFRTWLGLPPTKDDPPLCGAVLPDTWDWPDSPRPPCPACGAERARLLAENDKARP